MATPKPNISYNGDWGTVTWLEPNKFNISVGVSPFVRRPNETNAQTDERLVEEARKALRDAVDQKL